MAIDEGTLRLIAIDLEQALAIAAPKHDTELSGSIRIIVVGGILRISMKGYGLYVQFGTPGRLKAPPGQAPKPNRKMPMKKQGSEWISLVEKWGSDKLGISDKKAAFALARHIQLYGTRPNPFITDTIKKKLPGILNKYLG